MRIMVFTPYLYPFHVDMLEILSNMRSIEEVKLFTAGIYGNYPFYEFLTKAEKIRCFHFLGSIAPSPISLKYVIVFRPHVAILFGVESLVGQVLYLLLRALRVKVVVIVEENYITVHRKRLLQVLSAIKRLLAKHIYKTADVLVAESKASLRYLTDMLYIKRRVHLLPHGVSLDRFNSNDAGKLSKTEVKLLFIKKYSWPLELAKKIWVTFVGEPSYYKGIDILIDSINTLISRTFAMNDNSYVFLLPKVPILRDKPELVPTYQSKLCKLVQLGVVILYPQISMQLMPYLYAASDIIVLPSRLMKNTSSDRSPNVALEALAMGKIIIASYVGGIPDIVGNAGILIKPNDSNVLSNNILKVILNIDSYKHLESKAIARARTYLDVRKYVYTLLLLFIKSIKFKTR